MVTVRRVKPDEGPDVADLYLRSFRAALPAVALAKGDEEVRAHFRGPVVREQETWVAVDKDDEVLGFMTLKPGWVDHLYVDPDHRREGIGAALLKVATGKTQVPLRLYVFQANENARAFFEAAGFKLVDVDDSGDRNEEGEPDALLEWTSPA